jgi:hypothetical protein
MYITATSLPARLPRSASDLRASHARWCKGRGRYEALHCISSGPSRTFGTTPCGGGLVVAASRKRRQKGNAVSDETVKYGYWALITWPVSDCTVNYRPVFSSEKAPSKEEQDTNLVKGPKGRPDTQKNWSTDCRQQEELQHLEHAVSTGFRTPY